jgi:Concanavalin A-like lectin/glucanases superfamily
MTVAIYNLLTQYTGTGSRTFFEYGFALVEGQTVFVLVDGIPVAFTRQETGVVLDPAPSLNATILIYRETDVTQLEDFQSFESFDAAKTEWTQDKLIYLKQEALEYRARMNLYSDPSVDRVVLMNDKGTDATIFLWNLERAGMFAGRLGSMPNVGAQVDKPWNFAYFQCGGAPPPPENPFTDYEYFIFADNASDQIRYFGVDFTTGEDLEFGSFPRQGGGNSLTSDDTFIFTDSVVGFGYLSQMVWRGHVFSKVFDGLHGGSGPTSYIDRLATHDNFVIVALGNIFGDGIHATEYTTGAPFSFPTTLHHTATGDDWIATLDLRFSAPDEPGYGDALVCCPAINGNQLTTYQLVANVLTLVDQTPVSMDNLGSNLSAAWGWDRNTGLVARKFPGVLTFDLYQVEMSDLSVSKIGTVGNTLNFILAIGFSPTGYVVTLEDSGGGQDVIRTYSRDGLVLTLVDEYTISGASSTNARIQTSPYTNRIWVMCSASPAGTIALQVNSLGELLIEYTTPKSVNNSGGSGNPMRFLNGPLTITPNGFADIKAKLYECWQMNETGSVTRVGSMGNLNLTVDGTVTHRAGVISNAAEFTDGTSALIAATPIEMYGTGTISFCLDVYLDSKTGANQYFFGCHSLSFTTPIGSQMNWGVRFNTATSRFEAYAVVGTTFYVAQATDAGNPNVGQWYHLYGEYNAEDLQVRIRVDGGALYSAAVGAVINDNGTHLIVGRLSQAARYPMDGAVDGLFLFWDALDETEQDFMYNSGNSRAFADL